MDSPKTGKCEQKENRQQKPSFLFSDLHDRCRGMTAILIIIADLMDKQGDAPDAGEEYTERDHREREPGDFQTRHGITDKEQQGTGHNRMGYEI
ncbi:MAG: hypothetical protein ACYDEZ_00785 [Methanoregula sp.]